MFKPLLTQVRPYYFSVDCGMSYILRLGDGRFVIIDGNYGEYDEAEQLYARLCAQNELGGEPRIAAWFITHPHGDHFGCFVKFYRLYGDRVKIEKLLYHFPLPGVFDSEGSDTTEFLEVVSEIDSEIIAPQTGDRYVFADAEFEVIFCCADLYPGPVHNINNSSFVMKMHFGNYSVLWLGDLQREGSDYICSHLDRSILKCDILQVGHHGYGGGSDELYRAADPEYLLWPCPDFWFHPVRLWPVNEYLITSEKIKQTFVGGQGELVLDMSAPIEPFNPYTEREIVADFSKKSLRELGWSSVTGGKSGYSPASLEFKGGGVCLKAGDANTLVHLIHRGQVAKAEKYSFEISGRLIAAEHFGLIFDRDKIMEWDDGCYFELKPDGSFDYRLEVDRLEHRAALYGDGELLAEFSGLCPTPCDIILYMKNAEVLLGRVAYKEIK